MALKWNFVGGSVVQSLGTVSGGSRIQSITIAASADDVMPANAAYVAIEGSDAYGNGSRLRPFRTIAKTIATLGAGAKVLIFGEGIYYESGTTPGDGRVYVGNSKDNVTIDLTGLSSFGTTTTEKNIAVHNIKFINSKDPLFVSRAPLMFYNCTFKNISSVRGLIQSTGAIMIVAGCKFENSNVTMYRSYADGEYPHRNNSFYGCNISYDYNLINIGLNRDYDNVFKACNIRVKGANYAAPENWVIDPDCTFAFSAAGAFSSYPSLAALRAAFIAAYPGQTHNFTNCIFANPLYNNPEKGDLTLSKISPARKLATTGGLAGAENPAVNWNVINDVAEVVNFEVFDGEMVVSDSTIDASLTLKAKDFGSIYELHNIPIASEIIGRRGHSLTDVSTVSSTVINAGENVLTIDRAYLVINDTITWNSLVLPVNSRFYATTGLLSFTGSGAVKEIINVPNKRTCLLRVKTSIPATLIAAGANALTVGSDYIATGPITHNGINYILGNTFRAVNTAFTGTGSVRLVFSPSDVYHSFQINDGKIACNRVGNLATGAILRGNGDVNYDSTPANVFPVFAKYAQPKIIVKKGDLL